MIHLLFLASSLFVLQVSTQLSAYETWTTDYIRYCEMIQSTNAATPLYRGVACGRDAWNVMSTFFPLRITSTMTLGLINVAYITTQGTRVLLGSHKADSRPISAYISFSVTDIKKLPTDKMSMTALTDQSGFWNTCKPYMVRLFDGLWSDVTKACTLLVNPPWGFPNCTQDYDGAFVYRSGSGYCMKSKVCGATVEIDFLKSADNSSIIYTWTTTESEALIAQGYTKVGNCYGYSLLPNAAASNANLMNELSFP